MEFKVSTSAHRYSKEEVLLLKPLGFQFESCDNDNKKWRITNTPTIKLKSLAELMVFVEKYGIVVLSQDEISIYDDYRE
jgi:hypothetical protein